MIFPLRTVFNHRCRADLTQQAWDCFLFFFFWPRRAKNILISVSFLWWQIIFKFISSSFVCLNTKLNHKQVQPRHFISHLHTPVDPPPTRWPLTRLAGQGEDFLR
jgi:hypothetical protein